MLRALGAFFNPLSRFSKLTSIPEDFWCCVYGLRLGVVRITFSESDVAEGVGFEPTSRFRETVFKTAAFSHSAIPPNIPFSLYSIDLYHTS